MSPPPSPNAKLDRSYTLHKDREKLEQVKSGLQSEAAQGNIDVVLERLLKLDAKVHARDVPAVYKRALLRFHPDRHVGKPIAKRASYEERLVVVVERFGTFLSNLNSFASARAMFFSLSLFSSYEGEFEKEREKSDDSATVAFVVACGSPHPSRLNISFSHLRKRLLFR